MRRSCKCESSRSSGEEVMREIVEEQRDDGGRRTMAYEICVWRYIVNALRRRLAGGGRMIPFFGEGEGIWKHGRRVGSTSLYHGSKSE